MYKKILSQKPRQDFYLSIKFISLPQLQPVLPVL